MTTAVTDNQADHRYELAVGDQIVFALYRRDGTTVAIRHVEAPPNLRGTGAAGRLMQDIVDHARVHQLAIVPRCSYARAWFAGHPEAQDVLD